MKKDNKLVTTALIFTKEVEESLKEGAAMQ